MPDRISASVRWNCCPDRRIRKQRLQKRVLPKSGRSRMPPSRSKSADRSARASLATRKRPDRRPCSPTALREVNWVQKKEPSQDRRIHAGFEEAIQYSRPQTTLGSFSVLVRRPASMAPIPCPPRYPESGSLSAHSRSQIDRAAWRQIVSPYPEPLRLAHAWWGQKKEAPIKERCGGDRGSQRASPGPRFMGPGSA
jgi:hypothetical protein